MEETRHKLSSNVILLRVGHYCAPKRTIETKLRFSKNRSARRAIPRRGRKPQLFDDRRYFTGRYNRNVYDNHRGADPHNRRRTCFDRIVKMADMTDSPPLFDTNETKLDLEDDDEDIFASAVQVSHKKYSMSSVKAVKKKK